MSCHLLKESVDTHIKILITMYVYLQCKTIVNNRQKPVSAET